MKLRRMLVFSAVIVSLTLVAIAGSNVKDKEFTLKFKGEGDFCFDEAYRFVPCREEGDLLNVSHLGLSDVWYQVDPYTTDPENFGPFTITGANGDSLVGHYSKFELDMATGVYMLEWAFTGGTGRFEGAYGLGETDGLVVTWDPVPHAEFEFYGKIYVPKGKGKK